jgi:Flp pilus assembly pilin Flp
MRLLQCFVTDDQGQDLIEYALLAAFISLSSVAFITSIGTRVNEWYEGYNETIRTIPTGS